MLHYSVRLRRPVLLVAFLLCIPVSSFAQISFANTSNYAGSGRWNWTIYVQADRATLNSIECVEYTLIQRSPILSGGCAVRHRAISRWRPKAGEPSS